VSSDDADPRRMREELGLTSADWQAGVRPSLIKAAQTDAAALRRAVERAKNVQQEP
jgi:hypothetical protein